MFITPFPPPLVLLSIKNCCDYLFIYLFIYHDIQRVPIGYIIGKKQHRASPMRFYTCASKYTMKNFGGSKYWLK
jgi:hypothetical protein